MIVEASGSEATASSVSFAESATEFSFFCVVWSSPFWNVLESQRFFWVLAFEDSEFVFGTFIFFVFVVVIVVAKLFVLVSVVAVSIVVTVAVGRLVIFATVLSVGDTKADLLSVLVVACIRWTYGFP